MIRIPYLMNMIKLMPDIVSLAIHPLSWADIEAQGQVTTRDFTSDFKSFGPTLCSLPIFINTQVPQGDIWLVNSRNEAAPRRIEWSDEEYFKPVTPPKEKLPKRRIRASKT